MDMSDTKRRSLEQTRANKITVDGQNIQTLDRCSIQQPRTQISMLKYEPLLFFLGGLISFVSPPGPCLRTATLKFGGGRGKLQQEIEYFVHLRSWMMGLPIGLMSNTINNTIDIQNKQETFSQMVLSTCFEMLQTSSLFFGIFFSSASARNKTLLEKKRLYKELLRD